MACQPDKVAEHMKEKTEGVFHELQQAYEQQDISKVAEIIARIESGQWEDLEVKEISDLDILLAKKNNLELKLDELLKEIEEINRDEVFNELNSIEDIADLNH